MTVDFGTSNASSKTMTIANGTYVFDVLNGTHSVSYKDYASLGKLVTSIDGVAQNSTSYWFYYVNGNFAQVAADKYVLYNDSAVLFKFGSGND